MHRFYLFRLFQHNKLIGSLVSLYVVITLLMNLMGDQVSPFLLWAMFSKEETPKTVYQIPRIVADGETIKYSRQLWDANRHFLRSPILKYTAMKANDDRDPDQSFLEEKLGVHYTRIQPFHESITNHSEQYTDLEQWAKRYLARSIHRPVRQLQVFTDTYRFTQDGKLELVNAQLLFEQ